MSQTVKIVAFLDAGYKSVVSHLAAVVPKLAVG